MKLSSFKQATLGSAFALALIGCAGATEKSAPKDATALSLVSGKPAADVKKPALAGDEIVTDLAGAVRQAQDQRKSGDLTGAAHTLSQLVLAAPDDPRVLGEYGKTLVAQGRSQDALAFLERAIELQPAEWSLYSAQGVAYDQKGDYRSAQMSYDRALSLKPNEPTVLSNAALSHMQSGDLDGAERLLLQASPNGADYPRIAHNLALVQELKAAQAKAPAVAAVTPPAPSPKAPLQPAPNVAAAPSNSKVDTVILQAPAGAPPAPAKVTAATAHAAPAPNSKVDTAPLQAQAGTPPATPKVTALTTTHTAPAALQPAPARSIEDLKADPTVRMQAVPKDDQAGKKIAAKSVPPKKMADNGGNTTLLRPAQSDAKP